MKRSIIFFSRMGLVHLYGPLDQKLRDQYNIFHVAYSKTEAKKLKELYNVDVDKIFLDEVEFWMKKKSLDSYLLEKIDREYVLWSNNRFNLNGALISDRGFMFLSYYEALHLAQSYFLFWDEFISSRKECFLFHETTSLLFNHMGSIICSKYDCVYSGFIEARGKYPQNFIFLEFDDGRSLSLKNNYLSNDKVDDELTSEARRFIETFKTKAEDMSYSKRPSIAHDVLNIFGFLLKKLSFHLSRNRYDRILENIDYYMQREISSIKYLNRIIYRFKIKYDVYDNKDCYLLYPMHIEPEAVVQYWSGGEYTNQINLIEQIARNLPVNCFLYVKDHIHEFGYRNVADYQKIQEIPNVKLIDPGVSGLFLANKSKGIITVNGTMGLECIALGRPVYLLSSVYYDCFKGIIKIRSLKELNNCTQKPHYHSQDDVEHFISSYIKATFNGDVEAFFTKKMVYLNDDQLNTYAKAFREYISQINIKAC